jgi:uncharacterized protein DUF1801
VPAKPPRELVDFLRRYEPPVPSLALALREIVHDELTPCHEYIFDMRSKLVLLYSTTPRVMADGICHFAMNTQHITLGFMQGADMDDTPGLLRGSGKTMRHIRIEGASDLAHPALRAYLRQARTLAGMKRKQPGDARRITTKIKQNPREPKAPSAWPKKFF